MPLKNIGSIVAPALASVVVERAVDAARNWADQSRVIREIQLLVHQVVLDDTGRVPLGREQFEAAGLTFSTTELNLIGLVEAPVYAVEVTNTRASALDRQRTRLFIYKSDDNRFWEEDLVRTKKVGTRGSPLAKADETVPGHHEDRNWFLYEDHPDSVHSDIEVLYPVIGTIYSVGRRLKRNNRSLARIRQALEGRILDSRGQIQSEPRHLSHDSLEIWHTPLRSAMSERRLLHYLVVTNTRLPDGHPARTVALLYNAATMELGRLS